MSDHAENLSEVRKTRQACQIAITEAAEDQLCSLD